MSSNFINQFIGSVKIIILFLLILVISISKSIFLIMFMTVLILILIVLTKISVKECIKSIKIILPLLIFILIIYIIIYRDIIDLLIVLYKTILIVLLISLFMLTINFDNLHSAIYTIISPFCKPKYKRKKISFYITIYIFFIYYFLNSGSVICNLQKIRGKRKYGIKYLLLPRLFYTIDYIHNFERDLMTQFYELKVEKINFRSILILALFIVFASVAIFKEVIL